MAEMVAVIGTDGERIGEMYLRRAQQQVKKQRAVWLDEHRQAVRLLSGTTFDSDKLDDVNVEIAAHDERLLMCKIKTINEADRRRERRNFIWHTIALLPGYVFLFQFIVFFSHFPRFELLQFMITALIGAWTTLYIVHLITFIKRY